MEEFKGTKGEWYVGDDEESIFDENGFDIAVVSTQMRIKENWEELGCKHWGEKAGVSYVNVSSKEYKANAKLVAKAPELLEALEIAINYIPTANEDFDNCARLINELLYNKNESI